MSNALVVKVINHNRGNATSLGSSGVKINSVNYFLDSSTNNVTIYNVPVASGTAIVLNVQGTSNNKGQVFDETSGVRRLLTETSTSATHTYTVTVPLQIDVYVQETNGSHSSYIVINEYVNADNEQLVFLKGQSTALAKMKAVTPGALYHCLDTKETWLAKSSSLNDLSIFATGVVALEDLSGVAISTDRLNRLVAYTKHSNVDVAGVTKATYTYDPPVGDTDAGSSNGAAYFPEGIIMGGSAASAGLMTRGICGIGTANTSTGACTKDHLFINYDGTDVFNAARQLVLGAGKIGSHLGNNLYEYTAVRGDILKAYSDNHYLHKGTFSHNAGALTWGVLGGNDYQTVIRWDSPNNGSVGFADGPMSDNTWKTRTNMQIDGYFYQVEGGYRVLDESDISGVGGYHSKFTSAHTLGNSLISDDGSCTTIHSRLVVEGNGGSYNEGIRILPASNQWSNIYFSSDTSTGGESSGGGWLIGRRGTTPGSYTNGTIGDFTIEGIGSEGKGVTIKQNGDTYIYGSKFTIGGTAASMVYNANNQCINFVFN